MDPCVIGVFVAGPTTSDYREFARDHVISTSTRGLRRRLTEISASRPSLAGSALLAKQAVTWLHQGILKPKGQGRARQYEAGDELRKARVDTRIRKPMADPYEELAS